ncbi:hypothetical protein UlMin_027213 [Ulmus minor]
MYQDLKGRFWWSGLKKEVAEYVAKCLICQKVKAEHQRPGAKGHDAIWVVVDRLTKSAHFMSIKTTFSLEQLATLYVQEIVRLHGVPKSIVSDRDARFTSKFWKSVQQAMDFKGTWNRYLPLIEFSYNNSYQATIGMAPYEALYGRRYRSPVHWYETGESEITAPEFVEDTTQAVKKIQTRMKSAQSRQNFEEKPMQILDYKIKTLRNKDIPLVKVLWRNQKTEEATWEREDEMRTSYPELF